jgi:cytoskeletal protein CcmA (bactofilin family)
VGEHQLWEAFGSIHKQACKPTGQKPVIWFKVSLYWKGCSVAVNEKPVGAKFSETGGFLGHGTKLTGKVLFDGTTTIEGEVEGEVIVHGDLIIGEQATITGKITANFVLIRGKVTAEIQADKGIEIKPPGVLAGDIITQNLVIRDGAIFDGNCSMKKEQKEGKVLPLLRQGSNDEMAEEVSS